VKCVSLDLDGTLLNSNREISKTSFEIIKELQEKGIEVIINTGRAYGDVFKVSGIDELNCPLICVGGSLVYSKTGELQFEAVLDPSIYLPIYKKLISLQVGVLVYTNTGGYPSTLPPLHQQTKEEIQQMFSKFNYEEFFKRDDLKVYKLIALADHSELEKVERVKEELADIKEISMASSFPNNVEITSVEADKGLSLLRYAKINQIQFDEIYAFGDGGNDFSQFEVATKSVAMANAPENVKEQANIVTKSNDEDGVSYAIKKLLKLL
jgi:5-amino-6-(5-phospho-D-ribitylamino)uracil phosphatase